MISYIINIIWYKLNIKNLWYHIWYHVAQDSRWTYLFLTKCVLLLPVQRMRCFRMRCAPAGCRRASRVQAGRPGAAWGRNKAVAHSMCSDIRVTECKRMCPLNQDKKSAVKVYTGMYSVHTSIYFIWEFHTEIYGHILSYTYNQSRKSRHTTAEIYFWPIVYVEISYWVYTEIMIYDFLDFHTELYGSIV